MLKRTYIITENSESRAVSHSEKATGCKGETELSNQNTANNLIYNCRISTTTNKKSHEAQLEVSIASKVVLVLCSERKAVPYSFYRNS